MLQLVNTSNFQTARPTTRLSDLAGIDSILEQIRELVFYPTQYPELYSHLGVSPPCGILLHGPSGCGKTTLAAAIAGELGLPYFKVQYIPNLYHTAYPCFNLLIIITHVTMYCCRRLVPSWWAEPPGKARNASDRYSRAPPPTHPLCCSLTRLTSSLARKT